MGMVGIGARRPGGRGGPVLGFLAGLAALSAAAAILVAAAGAHPAAAAGDATCETSHAAIDGTETTLIAAINAERTAAGLPPYLVSARLSKAAAWMAEDLATSGQFSHTDSLGRSPSQRGLDCAGATMAENIAGGSFGGPAGVVAAWMGSPGHKANILSTAYASLGVGQYGVMWVVDFALSALDGTGGGSPPPTATPTQRPAATATPSPTSTPTKAATPIAPSPTPVPPQIPTPGSASAPASVPALAPALAPAPGSGSNASPGERQLSAGVNLITYRGPSLPPTQALGSIADRVVSIYQWDAGQGRWLRYFPGRPAYISTLATLDPGEAYFIFMSGPGTWAY